MKELSQEEIKTVNGAGGLSPSDGASLILALGAVGGPATFAFALPIASALYFLE